MICTETIKMYCCDDICHIENYDKAINDKTQTWHCHHRLETELNVCKQYLIDHELYHNRPASELIFLTPAEHISLHFKGKSKPSNRKSYYKDYLRVRKSCSEELKKRSSEYMKQWWALKKQGLL